MEFQIANTLELRRTCFALRAEEYARYYDNIPQDYFCDEIDIMQLPNGDCLSTTVYVEKSGEVIATARLVYAHYPIYNLIVGETFKLLNTDDALIAKLRQVSHINDTVAIAEVGKLAVSYRHRDPAVIECLYRGIGALAKERHIGLLIALIRPQIAMFSRMCGVLHTPFSEAHLDRSTLANMRYFFRFHTYFLPKLYQQCPEIFDEHQWERMPYQYLVDIASSQPDGAQLYWITPQTILC